jgi:hypothetical protein
MDWLNKSFVREVEQYLGERNPAFTVFLILDNAPSHAKSHQFGHLNTEVVFFPVNAMLFLQPMDQSVIAMHMGYHTHHTVNDFLDAMEQDPTLIVVQCWKTYSTANCISNIKVY